MIMGIFGSILGGLLTDALTGNSNLPAKVVTKVVKEVVAKASDDPVIMNQMNMEAPHQSRVVVGSTIGMVGGLFVATGHLFDMYQTGNFDIEMAFAEVTIIWGFAYALYGRLANGLKPLFSR